jgi:integrase
MPRKPFFRKFDGWWYAQINKGGRRKQIKLVKGKDKKQEAYRAFCRLVADETGELPTASAHTVASVCDFFLDLANRTWERSTFALHQNYLQRFCDRFGHIHVTELKPFHMTQWLDANAGWKASRRHAALCVKRAFRWAFEQGLTGKDPFATYKPDPPTTRNRILTAEEQSQIIAAIKDQEFRDFVIAMQETGCRPGEVASVTAENVNLELGVWVLVRHKTAKKICKPRVIYLTPTMVEMSRRFMEK